MKRWKSHNNNNKFGPIVDGSSHHVLCITRARKYPINNNMDEFQELTQVYKKFIRI